MLGGLTRKRCPEAIDDPGLDAGVHAHALCSLNRVNRWLGSDWQLARAMEMAFGPVATLSVADLGAGGGGFLSYLAKRRGGRREPPLIAIDRSWWAMSRATMWAGGVELAIVADALHVPLADNSVDVVTCSLFLHHFDEPEVEVILREAARVCRRGVVVSDLTRSRLAWGMTWATARVVSRSPIFHSDGPRSVRAAFRPDELVAVAQRAGLPGIEKHLQVPFRTLLVWRKAGSRS